MLIFLYGFPGAWTDHGALYELLEPHDHASAADPSTCAPAIFDAWANDDLASLIDVRELKAWPGAYRNPLLFLDGDPDAGSLVNMEGAADNMQRYPWARRIVMPGLDHGLGMWDDPSPVVEEIRRFFERLPPST